MDVLKRPSWEKVLSVHIDETLLFYQRVQPFIQSPESDFIELWNEHIRIMDRLKAICKKDTNEVT